MNTLRTRQGLALCLAVPFFVYSIWTAVVARRQQQRIVTAEALEDAGEDLYNRGEYTKSIVELRRAIALYPDLVSAYTYIGKSSEALGDIDPAAEAYRQAIRLRPSSSAAALLRELEQRRAAGHGGAAKR